ncbi:MAG: hypothetical protein AB7Q45_25615, partial [Planctomycetaceae bacterium]
MARKHVSESPLPDAAPKTPPHLSPYIYTRQELKRIFDEALNLRAKGEDPLLGITFRTLLILLYGAALRRGEALSLQGADVDLEVDPNCWTVNWVEEWYGLSGRRGPIRASSPAACYR